MPVSSRAVHREVAGCRVDAEAREHADEGDERGQQHHRDADAVDAEEEKDVVGGNPSAMLGELYGSRGGIEPGVEPSRDEQLRKCEGHSDPADKLLLPSGAEQDQNHPDERNEGYKAQRMSHRRLRDTAVVLTAPPRLASRPQHRANNEGKRNRRQDDVQVAVDRAGLKPPHPLTRIQRHVGGEIDQPVNHVAVEQT